MKIAEKALKRLQESGNYQDPWLKFEFEIWNSMGDLVAYGDDIQEAIQDYNKDHLHQIKKSDLKRFDCRWMCFLYEGEDPSVDTDHDGGKNQSEALKNLMSHLHV